MKFFFPDSRDVVDPSFDFVRETRSVNRILHRDDVYAHEVFSEIPFDGILLSKAIVDGKSGSSGKYSMAQRHRLLRLGIREFFRITDRRLLTMGDCGAFSYVKEEYPPYSVDEVIDFYDDCGFDLGVSVDHIILGYDGEPTRTLPKMDATPPEWKRRQEITLDLARKFLRAHKKRKSSFTPIGVAQGWSPASYAKAIRDLQRMGYSYIALGGLVPLKTHEILAILKSAHKVKAKKTQFHLFGVTRCEEVLQFKKYGVRSFDSTSPLRKAFKDDKDNYFTPTRTYTAIRVPQVDGNATLRRRILAGEVDQEKARVLEGDCLTALTRFDVGDSSLDETLDVLAKYEQVYNGETDHRETYRTVLTDKPWKSCPCDVCKDLGIHVILFRGADRNRRRGFHNLFVFNQTLQSALSATPSRRKKNTHAQNK